MKGTLLSRSRILLFLAVAVLVLAGNATTASADGPHTSSITGSWAGELTLTPTSDPYVVNGTDEAVGHVSRSGEVTWTVFEVDSLAAGTISNGSFTMLTPNGDAVSWAYSGTFVQTGPTTFSFSTHGVITGGTGRFQAATGQADFTGSVDISTGQLTGSLHGQLALP